VSDRNALEIAPDDFAMELNCDTECKKEAQSSSIISNSSKNNNSSSKPEKITLFHSEGSYYIEMKRTGESITDSDITE